MSSAKQSLSGIEDLLFAVKNYVPTGLFQLKDTPTGYLGHSGDYLVVNDGETGIHFTGIEKIATDLVDYGFGEGSSTIPSYTDLPDVTENDGKIVASGCDLYHSCNGAWNKIGGESIPPPAEAPACVTNLAEYNQYQEYKDAFLADNLGNTFDQMLNSNNDISNLIFDVCLFPESSLEEEKNTVIIDETTYKWGMFASPQTINISAQEYSDGQGNDCVFSEWTSSNANFGDPSNANTTVFVDTDLSITGSFECLVAPSQPSCNQVALHLQPAAGETIIDKSSNNHAITVVGDTTVDSTATLFGGDTMNFDGNGDYLTVNHSDLFNFGADDFTVEMWINFKTITTTDTVVMSHGDGTASSNWGWMIYGINGDLSFLAHTAGGSNWGSYIRIWDDAATTNRWYHVAVSKKDGMIRAFVDGVARANSDWDVTPHPTIQSVTQPLVLGKSSLSSRVEFNGYIQDLRISKKGVYTGNFTPSTNLLDNPC